MMRRLALLPIFFAILGAAPAPRTARWIAVGESVQTDAKLKGDASIVFAHVTPKTSYRLMEEAIGSDGTVLLPKGALLILTDGSDGAACQTVGAYGYRSKYACLIDSDGDHRFDRYVYADVMSEYFFQAAGRESAAETVRTPVRYEDLTTDAPTVDVKLQFVGSGGLVMPDRFALCFEGPQHDNFRGRHKSITFCSTHEITVRPSALPIHVDLHGGSITFLHKHGGAYDVQIVTPPPGSMF